MNLKRQFIGFLIVSLSTLSISLKAQDSQYKESSDSHLQSLTSTTEGCVLYYGWEDAEEDGYDISVLSEEEKALCIQNGLKNISEQFEKGQFNKNSALLAEVLSRYYLLKKDSKKSLYWAFKAAENGSSFCMFILSNAYRSGNGVVQDIEEGIKWAYLGAAAGNDWCTKWVNEYGTSDLSYEEFAPLFKEAKKRANQWMKEHSEIFISAE